MNSCPFKLMNLLRSQVVNAMPMQEGLIVSLPSSCGSGMIRKSKKRKKAGHVWYGFKEEVAMKFVVSCLARFIISATHVTSCGVWG